MRHTLLTYASLLLCQSITHSQSSWVQQNPLPTSASLNSVCHIDSKTATAVGDGTIIQTTNGGATWTDQSGGTTPCLNSVCFVDTRNGIAVGDNGTVLRTRNGGKTWTEQLRLNLYEGSFYGVWFSDTNTGTVVGDRGIIMRTINAGITWVEGEQNGNTEIPAGFVLQQNYPNPFNPKTVVSMQLPVVSDVRLAVYDILGREVAVLVNERKKAGTYSVTFDARGLASGVYVYRLTAGEYQAEKKMVMVR